MKREIAPVAHDPNQAATQRRHARFELWGIALGLYLWAWFYLFWSWPGTLFVALTVVGPPLFILWFLVLQLRNLFDSD